MAETTKTDVDLVALNRDWLRAWSDKDVDALLGFYHPDVLYRDNSLTDGVQGHAALRERLETIFSNDATTFYQPRRIWEVDDGYVGVWLARSEQPDGTTRFMRGLDYCAVEDGLIIQNDVYVHQLTALPASEPFDAPDHQ